MSKIKEKPRVGIYTRVSTDMQSTENQLNTIKSYCEARGWTDVKHYDDVGISGTTADRPALKRLLTDAKARKIDIVVVVKLDRLFRSLHQLIETLNEWSSIGVQFVAVNDQIDLTTAAGRLMMQIIGAFAEFESNIIRERVTAGVRAKKEKTGKWGRPTCDETTVAKIKKLRGNGLSMGDIAKELGISKGTVFNHSKSE